MEAQAEPRNWVASVLDHLPIYAKDSHQPMKPITIITLSDFNSKPFSYTLSSLWNIPRWALEAARVQRLTAITIYVRS